MATKRVDLTGIFNTVTQNLAENQQSLDQADTYNHDHGSNMVQTFRTITDALEEKKGRSASSSLAYAAKKLSRNATSSSSQLYAQNLNQAANQFKGKRITEKGALELLQTLIGSQTNPSPGDSATGGNDMLGDLLGGLMGSQPATQANAPAGGDMLGSLLGGLVGGSNSSTNTNTQSGFGLQNILAAGMAYMQAKQSGQDTMQSLVQAFAASSGMGNSAHRTQSTEVVVQSFLQALGSMGAR